MLWSSPDARPPASRLRIPAGPACSSLASHTAPVGRSVPNALGRVRLAPEAPAELQQDPRRAAVLQGRDRPMLIVGQARFEDYVAQRRGRQRRDAIIAAQLVAAVPVLAGHHDLVVRARDASHDVLQLHLGTQRAGDGPRQRLVPAANPERSIDGRARRGSGLTAGGQLIDQRDQRQFLRIGEEEAAQPAQPGFEGPARSLARHPLRHRLPRQHAGHGLSPIASPQRCSRQLRAPAAGPTHGRRCWRYGCDTARARRDHRSPTRAPGFEPAPGPARSPAPAPRSAPTRSGPLHPPHAGRRGTLS